MGYLVIAPHPDDEVLGCGGVIAKHSAEGKTVNVLVVSRGIAEIFPFEEIENTRRELRLAHEILGVNSVSFLDFPAPKLDVVPAHELADAIGKVVQTLQPTEVYLPHGGDLHGDHKAVYRAGLVACRPINKCSVKRLLCYETLSETDWAAPASADAFVPTIFVDITAQLDSKLKAMECYKSQLKDFPHARSLKGIEAQARLRGSTVGRAAAEAFMLVREIVG
ncbi:MAG: PIG-L deacetylase family protein [Pyrinomonadaceae bacterium]